MARAPHIGVVMIVEDDKETASGLAEILEILGYHSEIAENGETALTRLREAPSGYCLVILDVMMPVMDGWDFLTEHRRDEALANIPVVVVTAAVDAHAKAANTGAVAVLPKPLDTVKLSATVRQYC